MSAQACILIIDDDPNLRKTLGDVLRIKGFLALSTGMGREALERVSRDEVAVALLDLRLGDMSGLEVLRGIKQRSPQTECIMLTGHASQDSAIESLNLGAYSYFEKPFQMEQLLASIQHAVERQEARRALHRRSEELALVAEAAHEFSRSLDLDRVLAALLQCVQQVAGAEACSVALVDSSPAHPGGDRGGLVFRHAVGLAAEAVVGLRLQFEQGIAGWVAEHRQAALVPDVTADPRFYGRMGGDTGFVTRSLLCVPLIARDTVIGVIELLNKRRDPDAPGGEPAGVPPAFTTDDVHLVESVAAHAAIAIDNAWLFETERAGRQRLETLYRIGQTINSSLQAGEILDLLTDEAMRATHATHGSALVAHPNLGRFERRSLRGYSPELVERARSEPLALDRGANGRAYQTRQVVYVSDVRASPDYHQFVPDTRSELVVPFMRGDQVIGNLDLQSPEVDAFRDADTSFLRALTDQVAVALDNARLFEETLTRAEQLSLLYDAGLTLNRELDPNLQLSALFGTAMLALRADRVEFFRHDAAHDEVRFELGIGYGAAAQTALQDLSFRVGAERGVVGLVSRQRTPLYLADVCAHPGWVAIDPDTRSGLFVPVEREGRFLGVLCMLSTRLAAFTAQDEQLLVLFSNQAAVAMENARLYTALAAERASLAQRVEERTAELHAANTELRRAHVDVSHALEKERELGELKTRFISMASHEFRTPLATILSSAELLEHYGHKWSEDKKLEHLRRIQTAIQNMAVLLDDVLLVGKADAGKLGFSPAPLDLERFCRDLVEELQLGAGAWHSLVYTVQGDATRAQMDERLLRHILANLLSNAIKYSPRGSAVCLKLTSEAGRATFVIQDQGIGIPPADQAHLFEPFHRAGNVKGISGTGLGLTIVKRSVELHGGSVAVTSAVDQGTTVTVTLPLGVTP